MHTEWSEQDRLRATALGWNDQFERHWSGLDCPDCTPARVISQQRDLYHLQGPGFTSDAVISGRLRQLEIPAVGDWVAVLRGLSGDLSRIEAVLPRRTGFSRKVAGDEIRQQVLAANVDWVWIVSDLGNDTNLRRLERFLSVAWESGASPVIVLTKSDLCEDPGLAQMEVENIALGVPVNAVSSRTGAGMEALEPYLETGKTVVLLGPSGVGKSTLVNRLAGRDLMQTGAIRDGDGKGRHTTTHREIIPLASGALLMDTPGLRELQLWDASDGIAQAFADIQALSRDCHFADCGHQTEPGCAVINAVDIGQLSEERLMSFLKLGQEQAHHERQVDVHLRQEGKRHEKILHKAMRANQKIRR
jgi:ribosome biogenesis GTPase